VGDSSTFVRARRCAESCDCGRIPIHQQVLIFAMCWEFFRASPPARPPTEARCTAIRHGWALPDKLISRIGDGEDLEALPCC